MPQQSQKPRDLTRAETCSILGVCSNTVDQLIANGTLQSYKLGNDRRSGRRIRHESVERLRNGG